MVTGSSASRKHMSQKWLCLWPGFVRLWFFGDFSSLLFAVGFSILLNFALLSTFVWPQWLGPQFPIVTWSLLFIVWIGSWLISHRQMKGSNDTRSDGRQSSDALFITAQTEYLKGNWHEAEALMVRQLRFRPRDVESRLLLASTHVHSGNFDEAQKQIEQLEKLDASSHWQFELDQLRVKIQTSDELIESEMESDLDVDSELEFENEKEVKSEESNINDIENEPTTSEPGVIDSVLNKKAA